MSINVTVSGNPVSIKRGKMVTADVNYNKKQQDFEKRRLMRLEQVRQQSKDIAEDVRNKVRKEKSKQLGEIEREGKEKLRNWKNRKLLDIQNQYEEALQDIGKGHKQAALHDDENQIREEQKVLQDRLAQLRASEASCRVEKERRQQEKEQQKSLERRKLVRNVENTRSSLVTNLKRNSVPSRAKRKKIPPRTTADINITIPESEEDVNEYSEDEENKCDCESSSAVGSNGTESGSSERSSVQEERLPLQSIPLPQSDKIVSKNRAESQKRYEIDSRISDRIKRRPIMLSQPDYVESTVDIEPTEIPSSSRRVQEHLINNRPIPTKEFDNFSEESVQDVIPVKPPIRLKESVEKSLKKSSGFERDESPSKKQRTSVKSVSNTIESDGSKPKRVPYKHVIQPNPVEKISRDSLEVIPNLVSEAELLERNKQRELEAQERGKKALEKEKTNREYQEMLKKLPQLQKKDRINEIHSDKPEYHMNEERLKEQERRKQLELENAYIKFMTEKEPAVITIPSKNKIMSGPPLKSQDWEEDKNVTKMFTAAEVEHIIDALTGEKPQEREEKLQELLRDLKMQKKQLMDEIKSLPDDNSMKEMLLKLEKGGGKSKEKSKRKRSHESSNSSNSSFTEVDSRKLSGKVRKSKSKQRKREGSSPRKKSKCRSVLVLQNMSTQTTPKVTSSEQAASPSSVVEKGSEASHVCNCASQAQAKRGCICVRSKEQQTDFQQQSSDSIEDVCQIIIKINDDTPKVLVKPIIRNDVVKDQTDKNDVPKIRKEKKKISQQKTTPRNEEIPDVSNRIPSTSMRSKSWRDELSRHTSSSKSTSYISPPVPSPEPKQDFSHGLRGQPKQQNLSSPESNLSHSLKDDAELLNYIKQLLSMPRTKIDNLTASSSEVPTPSQSIIETKENTPMLYLHKLVKYFNDRMQKVAKDLSVSPEQLSIRSRKSCICTTPGKCNCSHAKHNSPNLTVSSRSGSSRKSSMHESDYISHKDDSSSVYSKRSSRDSSSVQKVCSDECKDTVLSHYMNITDNCNKRISDLAKKIEALRKEKEQMLQTSSCSSGILSKTDQKPLDESTKYNVPPEVTTDSEEDLHKKITDIDVNLGRRLRKNPTSDDETASYRPNILDFIRLSNLQFEMKTPATSKEKEKAQDGLIKKDEEPYIPIVSDIPKPKKLESSNDQVINIPKKRPSSSPRIINGDVVLVPHELSTILEADSQISTVDGRPSSVSVKVAPNIEKIAVSPQSPTSESSKLPSSTSSNESIKDENLSTSKQDNSPRIQPLVTLTRKQVSEPKPSTSKQLESKTKKENSSSSSDDLENVVTMLCSIGMSWAVPTLYKTREALAMSSSSSSLEYSGSKKSGAKLVPPNSSDVSLNEFLQKQILAKVSSSSLKSDITPGSVWDFSELSAINADKQQVPQQRLTSTPVFSSKSTNKGATFTGDSDLSSVKEASNKSTDKCSFYSASGQSGSK